jgi:hypothetical protein
MPFVITCSDCGSKFPADVSIVGRRVPCPACGVLAAVTGGEPFTIAAAVVSVRPAARPTRLRGPWPLVTGLALSGLVAVAVLLVGLAVWHVASPLASESNLTDRAAAERAGAERAAAERAAADRAEADQAAAARAEAEWQRQKEEAAFRKAMLARVESTRRVTTLLRSAPSPPVLHRTIRDAGERLVEAGRLASGHVACTPDGPVPLKGDAIGNLWVWANNLQVFAAFGEDMAELSMTAMRTGMFQIVGPISEGLSLLGRMLDDSLDTIEDKLKQPGELKAHEIDPAHIKEMAAIKAKLKEFRQLAR